MIPKQPMVFLSASVLHVLAVLLILIAIVCFYVEQSVNVVVVATSLAGTSLWLVAIVQNVFFVRRSGDQQHSLKALLRFYGWRKSAIIIALVCGLSLIVIGVNYFAYSLPYRWDVTRSAQHTLSSSTAALVEGLQSKVEISVLYVGLPPKYLEDLLAEYRRISAGAITTEIIDPIANIGQAAKFGNVISNKQSRAIIRSGNERQDIDFTDSPLTEEQLTNALVRVTRSQRQACFVTGHGEYSVTNQTNQGLSTLAALLQSNHVASKSLMLGIEGSIPDDCNVLIVAGPRKELTQQEKLLIESYLLRGGDALFLIENTVVTTPDKPLTAVELHQNPSLNTLLNQWGVNVGTDVVVDLSSHVGGDVGSPATRNYKYHKAITAGLDYTFYVRPRSMSALEQRRATIRVAPIVMTASKDRSWGETNRTLSIEFDEHLDTPGPVAISFVIWEAKEQGEQSDTRIIAFTDADFLTNAYINQYSNAEMGLNIVSWLSEIDYTAFVNQKAIGVERLDLTSKQRRVIIAILFLMPLLVAIVGILAVRKF